ncbi:hypothetical protein CYMTET_48150 [Cymbomonas tetramitiformis]|uniref:Uncharacterized protein n=1 Tax=Cymbomonas tetramitiformis TaxID=36881 RepID=A0AAE0BSX3_9CHLO|nr:hypothetical protein CYMTET_48150 [Cymbomonas tetramitiformis]
MNTKPNNLCVYLNTNFTPNWKSHAQRDSSSNTIFATPQLAEFLARFSTAHNVADLIKKWCADGCTPQNPDLSIPQANAASSDVIEHNQRTALQSPDTVNLTDANPVVNEPALFTDYTFTTKKSGRPIIDKEVSLQNNQSVNDDAIEVPDNKNMNKATQDADELPTQENLDDDADMTNHEDEELVTTNAARAVAATLAPGQIERNGKAIATSNTVVNANAGVTAAIDDANAPDEEIVAANLVPAIANTSDSEETPRRWERNGKMQERSEEHKTKMQERSEEHNKKMQERTIAFERDLKIKNSLDIKSMLESCLDLPGLSEAERGVYRAHIHNMVTNLVKLATGVEASTAVPAIAAPPPAPAVNVTVNNSPTNTNAPNVTTNNTNTNENEVTPAANADGAREVTPEERRWLELWPKRGTLENADLAISDFFMDPNESEHARYSDLLRSKPGIVNTFGRRLAKSWRNTHGMQDIPEQLGTVQNVQTGFHAPNCKRYFEADRPLMRSVAAGLLR